MDAEANLLTKTLNTRHTCFACYKQFNKKEHLVEHMKISYHSPHQPICGVCQKHCKSYESLREHLAGPLAKVNCSKVFPHLGCSLCLKIFDGSDSLSKHRGMCRLSAPGSLVPKMLLSGQSQADISSSIDEGVQAVAIDCEMVGGGSDGSVDLCARVCLVDEDENVVFNTYVQPQNPVTNYRYELTGITEALLRDAMPLKEVHKQILGILYRGESVRRQLLGDAKARLLVGHDLKHDLDCLRMSYPHHLLRDTAKYRPLMKTNLVSHSLKYLVKTYLGYDIQTGRHDCYEDCVSAMRLYKRMRAQNHQEKGTRTQDLYDDFDSWKHGELLKMTPDELYRISKLDYRCWCLDSKQGVQLS